MEAVSILEQAIEVLAFFEFQGYFYFDSGGRKTQQQGLIKLCFLPIGLMMTLTQRLACGIERNVQVDDAKRKGKFEGEERTLPRTHGMAN